MGEQARYNTKQQFSSSPNLSKALTDAMDAHTTMSGQALNSEKVRKGLIEILLGPAKLYETLREAPPVEGA